MLKTLANEDVTMVATADQVSDEKLAVSTGHSHEDHEDEDGHGHEDHDHGNVDPHVWLSPTISQDLALSIKNTLVEKMPQQEATFTANYEALVKELQDLDNEFKAMADKAQEKTFFVSHAAFGYIAGQYGLKQVPIAGLNSQNEPSQKNLRRLLIKPINCTFTIFYSSKMSLLN